MLRPNCAVMINRRLQRPASTRGFNAPRRAAAPGGRGSGGPIGCWLLGAECEAASARRPHHVAMGRVPPGRAVPPSARPNHCAPASKSGASRPNPFDPRWIAATQCGTQIQSWHVSPWWAPVFVCRRHCRGAAVPNAIVACVQLPPWSFTPGSLRAPRDCYVVAALAGEQTVSQLSLRDPCICCRVFFLPNWLLVVSPIFVCVATVILSKQCWSRCFAEESSLPSAATSRHAGHPYGQHIATNRLGKSCLVLVSWHYCDCS
jgi:hypothetical protein